MVFGGHHFDQPGSWMDYADCMPVIHVGFLDFAPFPECAEFYATYKLLNIKNYHLYSDKFTLCVVDLSHIELATVEDKFWGINNWARLFKAKTWEELKMISENNISMTEASENLYILNADKQARDSARAWQEYIVHEQAVQRREKMYQQQLAEKDNQLASLTSENEALVAMVESLRAKLETYKAAPHNSQT